MQFGIRFPDRAEDLARYSNYRVFLEHWEPLITELREMFRTCHVRGASSILGIYGPQGAGKTLFAKQLATDVSANTPNLQPFSDASLWHQVLGSNADAVAIVATTAENTKLFAVDSQVPDVNWLTQAEQWIASHPNHRCLLVIDEADQAFFLQALVEMSDVEFAQYGASPATIQMAAQRLVKRLRSTLRGTLCLLLSNNRTFLTTLNDAVDTQHAGVMKVVDLPLPSSEDKERIVRVNTNLLNPFSYWYCLSNAAPEQRRDVYLRLRSADTFPAAFKAIDTAIASADRPRTGRPSRKCILSLVVLSAIPNLSATQYSGLGNLERTELAHAMCRVDVFDVGWATTVLGPSDKASLLESEWSLRLITLTNPVVASILGATADARALLEQLFVYQGPGTKDESREEFVRSTYEIGDRIAVSPAIVDTTAFWQAGQPRSLQYERVLAAWFPGYNTGSAAGIRARPDLELEAYGPCSILGTVSENDAHLREAIRRHAHVVEFTSQQTPSAKTIAGYLLHKLPNYIDMMIQ